MPRPRLGTPAERQARYLARQSARAQEMRAALERIAIADTVEEARQIAASIVAVKAGFEPATARLTAGCSTD